MEVSGSFWRFRPGSVAAFGCLGALGCREPKTEWSGPSCASENFAYYVRDQDRALCPSQPELLEQHATLFSQLLFLGQDSRSKVHYYKYADAADLEAAGKCGGIGDACTYFPEIHTTRPFDQHELIHAYTANGWKPVLYAEGVAEALTCRTRTSAQSCRGDWRTLLNERGNQQVYDCGARLVYRLLTRGSISRLTELASLVGASGDADRLASAVREVYSVDLDAIWNDEVLSESRYCVPFWDCAGEELPVGTTFVPSPGAARLRLPWKPGMLVRLRYRDVAVAGAVELARCSATPAPDPDDRWQVSEASAPDVWIETNDGDYAAQVSGGALEIEVRPGQIARSCTSQPRYPLELGRPLGFLLRHDGQQRFFSVDLDRMRPVEFVLKNMTVGFTARWCTGCAYDGPAGCVDLVLDRDGHFQATVDDGVLVVTTELAAAPSGSLVLRARRDDGDA